MRAVFRCMRTGRVSDCFSNSPIKKADWRDPIVGVRDAGGADPRGEGAVAVMADARAAADYAFDLADADGEDIEEQEQERDREDDDAIEVQYDAEELYDDEEEDEDEEDDHPIRVDISNPNRPKGLDEAVARRLSKIRSRSAAVKKTPEQLEVLEAKFAENDYPQRPAMTDISEKTGLTYEQVSVRRGVDTSSFNLPVVRQSATPPEVFCLSRTHSPSFPCRGCGAHASLARSPR